MNIEPFFFTLFGPIPFLKKNSPETVENTDQEKKNG